MRELEKVRLRNANFKDALQLVEDTLHYFDNKEEEEYEMTQKIPEIKE